MSWQKRIYQLHSSDNYDNFMKRLGAPEEYIDEERDEKPMFHLRRFFDQYQMLMWTRYYNIENVFMPERNYIVISPEGRKVRVVYTFEDANTLKEEQTNNDGSVVTIIREFTPQILKSTSYFKGDTLTQIYKVID